MSSPHSHLRPLARIALTAALLLPAAAGAQTADNFYRGKQVSLVISTAAGGGYDTYGRVLARHIGAHLPGNPTVVPQNMPGAGGLRATGFIYNVAPRDGATFALVHGVMVTADLFLPDGAKFEAPKLSWIGNMYSEPSFCVAWHDSPIKTIEDLQTKEFVVGGAGSGGGQETEPRVLEKVLGAKFRLVSGYQSGSEVALAIERGEVHGRCGWPIGAIRIMRPQWLVEGKIRLIVQIGLDRDPNYPDVPLLRDLLPDPQVKAATDAVFLSTKLIRPVIAPPGLPAERLAVLRRAFLATLADPAFLADAADQHVEVDPLPGEEVQRLVEETHRLPPEVLKLAASLAGM